MDERFDFLKNKLSKADVPSNPMLLLQEWLQQAIVSEVPEYQAMNIASVSNGQVSSRIVYMRELMEEGIIFYTNYKSRKGEDFKLNQSVAINFHWKELERQVRIEGVIELADESFSDNYFNNRPRQSKIGAWASEQSQEIPNRAYLEQRVEQYNEKFEGIEVPRPEHWGGYLVRPTFIEFWQGRKSRLHDRIAYQKEEAWSIKRLAP